MLETTTVHRKPLKEEVFEVLHSRIIAGQYSAGEWLRQEDISSQLGVSMTPVREALDLLVSTGLAERVPYRGVRVLEPSSKEIVNSYGMRLLLETTAVFGAAQQITAGQVSQLRLILHESRSLVTLDDMSRQRVLSRQLHGAIVAASGNTQLHRLYMTVLNTFPDWMLFEYLFRHPELLTDSMKTEYFEHSAIVDAVARRDPASAVDRTIEHLLNRGKELHAYLGIPADLVQDAEAQVLPLLRQRTMPKNMFEEESV
ncbi:MAG TPA: GntR family transcriptional regulator [Anaerolineales bacterium]|nr:GntR family transcriptional regulator [Anaerolineales bacterium]